VLEPEGAIGVASTGKKGGLGKEEGEVGSTGSSDVSEREEGGSGIELIGKGELTLGIISKPVHRPIYGDRDHVAPTTGDALDGRWEFKN
jgi:hypothetical protein